MRNGIHVGRVVLQFLPIFLVGPATAQDWIPRQVLEERTVFGIPVDVDGDAFVDLVAGVEVVGSDVAWFQHPGLSGDPWARATIVQVGRLDALHSADIDGDGAQDVLTVSGNDLRWHRNQSAGGSWSDQLVANDPAFTFSFSEVIATGDLDGDGDIDIALSLPGSSDSEAVWFENLNEDGTAWARHAIASPDFSARGATLADRDGDGDLDFLIGGGTVWYLNSGDGSSWTEEAIVPFFFFSQSIAAGDLDEDGDVDVVASTGQEVVWFENDAGSWVEHPLSPEPAFVTGVGDFDLDGDPDVLGPTWFENLGGAQLWADHVAAGGLRADLDGDGDVDAVTSGLDGLSWHQNTRGTPLLWEERLVRTLRTSFGSVALAGDIDGDGDPDVLTHSDSPMGWQRNVRGDGTEWEFVPMSASYLHPGGLGDFDGDGALDVVTGESTTVRVLRNVAGDGTDWSEITLGTGYSPSPADVDGDGDLDVFVGSFSDLFWYENTDGLGSAWQRQDILRRSRVGVVEAADFDGDGDPDLVYTTASPGARIYYVENVDDDAGLWSEQLIAEECGVCSIVDLVPADMDGDGDLDTVAHFGSRGGLVWLENRMGASLWVRHAISENAGFATAMTAGDVDDDGDVDVLVAANDENILWFENLDGGASSWAVQSVELTRGARSLQILDLDLDGDRDVLVASGGSGSFGARAQVLWLESPQCSTISFEEDEDRITPLGNGQAIRSPEEFGEVVAIDTAGLWHFGAAVFDSSSTGPNATGTDPDLLVDLGNVLILQEHEWQAIPGFFDVPDDSRMGGTFLFDFPRATELQAIDLIDICPGAPTQGARLTLIDVAGRIRTYEVPGGWTTDVTVTPPGYGTLDLRTLEDQPGAQAVATAVESPGFDPTAMIRLEVFVSSSAAVDNLSLCVPIPRYGSRPVSAPSGPLRFAPMPSGLTGTWASR